MQTSLFEFQDYRAYLLESFGDKSHRKGLKSQAAKFMGCHSTLVSQILHGQTLPSLEHADKLNQFLGHSEEESHFFLLLVQKARAGTKTLEKYFQNQLEQIQKNRQVLKKRVGKTDIVVGESESRYYSGWQPAAIHVALSIPELSDADRISKSLAIPLAQVRSILQFLSKTGLALATEKQNYTIGPKHIHLGADSPWIKNHHTNWRLKAIDSIDQEIKSNFHYSSAITLAREDVVKITELLINSLKAMNKVIIHSKEEQIYALNMDFFNLRKG